MLAHRITGIATIALALGFNIPFAILGATFQYPDILRRPSSEILEAFHAGGSGLILTWYAFMISALAMVPIGAAIAAALTVDAKNNVLRQIAIVTGAAAGLLQAVGLSRWIFAVPQLAMVQADPTASESARLAAQSAFDMLNHWGGIAIGEHLGQMLTVIFLLSLSVVQLGKTGRLPSIAGWAGLLAGIMIAIGLGEGLAIATGTDPGMLALFTVVGYLVFTLWLLITGTGLIVGEAGNPSPVGQPT